MKPSIKPAMDRVRKLFTELTIEAKRSELLQPFRSGIDEAIERFTTEILMRRAQIQEEFAVAYMAETGLKVSEIELVERVSDDGRAVRWYFQPKARPGQALDLGLVEAGGVGWDPLEGGRQW